MRMGQHMKLAPRMIQSMEILQMPMLALQERVEEELVANAALEIVEPQDDVDATPAEDGLEQPPTDGEPAVSDSSSDTGDWQRLSEFESFSQMDNEYSSQNFTRPRAGERDRKMDAMANTPARGKSLTEVLLDQWSIEEIDPLIAPLGALLISYIDDDGLLGADLETILDQHRNVPGMDLSMEGLERALAEVKGRLEPAGIGARTRRECLVVQIDRFEAEPGHDPAFADVRRLVVEHFDDLLQNRLPRIVEQTGLDMDRIHAALALMRKLRISPGRDLVDVEVPPIIPDVIIEFDEEAGEYVAALSDGLLPTLRISRRCQQMARDRTVEKQTREFVGKSVRNAQWLIESINQRKNTLLRVVRVVLTRQRDFLDHGPQHLKPLPMIEVADQLGIHVGTVSRAVADKWLQTPRGVVALRKFFSGGTETDTGRNMSWDAIKAKLREIVDNEDKSTPLSDAGLADELKKAGIEIARRTVVQYRQQLDIPPARRRKVY